jgi:D-amino-acid oxidase
VQGQVVRVTRPAGEAILVDETGDFPTYVVPRDHDCILGGTAVENAWQRTPDPAVTAAIVDRCRALCPALRESRILSAHVGLRPGRRQIRLEAETLASGKRVIHNYGHGGAGFTTAWGTALAVLQLLQSS